MNRPHTVNLSDEEVSALVKFHSACARRIPKQLGKALLENHRSLFSRARTMKIFHEEATRAVQSRVERAKELLKLLKK